MLEQYYCSAAFAACVRALCALYVGAGRMRQRVGGSEGTDTGVDTCCVVSCVLQLTFLEDQIPYLIPTAREALRGMDRKPISDLVT